MVAMFVWLKQKLQDEQGCSILRQMSSEILKAKFLTCSRCRGPVIRKDISNPLYICEGTEDSPHPTFMISSKYDTKEGVIPEGPFIDWEELELKAKSKNGRISLLDKIQRIFYPTKT